MWTETFKSIMAISGHSILAPLETIGQYSRNYYMCYIRHLLDYSLDYTHLTPPFSRPRPPAKKKTKLKTKSQNYFGFTLNYYYEPCTTIFSQETFLGRRTAS